MEKFRLMLRESLIVIFCIFIGYCIATYVNNDFEPTITERHCGIIISKSNDEVAIKHGSRTQLFLNIQFNKKGFESVEVEPTTYFKYKVGECICIDFHKNDAIIAIGFIASWLLIIVVAYFFICWLFGFIKF